MQSRFNQLNQRNITRTRWTVTVTMMTRIALVALVAFVALASLLPFAPFASLRAQPTMAQVLVTPLVTPPYSPYLSDYIGVNNKLTVRLTNLSQTLRQVRLAGTVRGLNNGVTITLPDTYVPTQPIILPPGGALVLTSQQLTEYFAASNVQYTGITLQEAVLGNGLPEGAYQLCMRALDFATGQSLSQDAPVGCSPVFTITHYEPPFLLMPSNASAVPASVPQSVVFNWTVPAGVNPNDVQYQLRIAEVFPQNADANQAMLAATTPRLLERTVRSNNFLYGPAEPPLELGKRYAWQVVAERVPGGPSLLFKNGGRSVAFGFIYGQPQQIAQALPPAPPAAPANTSTPANTNAPTATTFPKPSVRALGVEANGVERSVIEVRVEEFLSRKLHPLVNFVFFDNAADTIPARYNKLTRRSTPNFQPLKLYNRETNEVYYDVLNIIGHRLQTNPSESVTLTGCLSTSEKDSKLGGLGLRRAMAVRQYLLDAWGIRADRVMVKERELPEKPTISASNELAGDAENRRVEIMGSWEMLRPLMLADTLREATPPVVRFYTDVKDDPAYNKWSISADQNGRTLRTISSTRKITPTVDWRINREKNSVPIDSTGISYKLGVTYPSGKAKGTTELAESDPKTIPVQQITIQRKRKERSNDVERDRYAVVQFDFGSDALTETITKALEIIKQDGTIKATSKVMITGYTDDIIGTPDANEALAKRRAEAVATALGVTSTNVKELQISGSTKVLQFDTDTPEGRFYCRTVVIVVENPIVLD
jgi:TANFOR domain-containing protein